MTAHVTTFEISHRTTYAYRSPVAQSHHLLHLKPLGLPAQKVLHHSLLIEPAPVSSIYLTDFFGNAAAMLRIADEHSELVVHARSTVELAVVPPTDLANGAAWDEPPGETLPIDVAVRQFACQSRHSLISRELKEFALASFPSRRPVLAGAMHLTRRIFEEFAFDPRATDVSTPVARVLETRRGVCQDFAHLAISALRVLGLPARYVSGYLLTRPPPGKPKLKGADASHAWLSVWAPGIGWVDFDPTNGLVPVGEHITVAYGRDYDDISPISGVLLGGGEQTMSIAVDVDLVT